MQYQMYLFEHPLAIDSNQVMSDSLPQENLELQDVSTESHFKDMNESIPASDSPFNIIEQKDSIILPQQKRLKKGKKVELQN